MKTKYEKQVNEQLYIYHSFLCGKLSDKISRRRFRKFFKETKIGEVTIPLIDLCITTVCSLKCKNCFHLIPNYQKDGRTPFNVGLEQIERDFDKLHEAIDNIVKVNILGGEPFLHPQIDEILTYVLTKSKVGYFRIVSNGTVVPKESTCQKLNNDRILVCLSDYHTGKEKISEIVDKFDAHGINYVIEREQVWYDFGEVEKKELTEKELEEHYKNCDYARCKALMEGELHTCAYAKHAERQGLVPDYGEALKIHEYSVKELREHLKEFLNAPYFRVCAYCNAPNQKNSKPIPAGEQE